MANNDTEELLSRLEPRSAKPLSGPEETMEAIRANSSLQREFESISSQQSTPSSSSAADLDMRDVRTLDFFFLRNSEIDRGHVERSLGDIFCIDGEWHRRFPSSGELEEQTIEPWNSVQFWGLVRCLDQALINLRRPIEPITRYTSISMQELQWLLEDYTREREQRQQPQRDPTTNTDHEITDRGMRQTVQILQNRVHRLENRSEWSQPEMIYPAHHACPDSYPEGTRFATILRIPNEFFNRINRPELFPRHLAMGWLYNRNLGMVRGNSKEYYLDQMEYPHINVADQEEFDRDCKLIRIKADRWWSGLHARAEGATFVYQNMFDYLDFEMAANMYPAYEADMRRRENEREREREQGQEESK